MEAFVIDSVRNNIIYLPHDGRPNSEDARCALPRSTRHSSKKEHAMHPAIDLTSSARTYPSRGWRFRLGVASFGAIALLLLSASIAVADTLRNDFDSTPDSEPENVTIEVGGATQVRFFLGGADAFGDGDPDCNIGAVFVEFKVEGVSGGTDGAGSGVITADPLTIFTGPIPEEPSAPEASGPLGTMTVTGHMVGQANVVQYITVSIGGIESFQFLQFTVTVVDTTAPVLTNVPANQMPEATSPSGAVVTFDLPAATDAVDPGPSVRCTPGSGSTFPLGTTTVRCTATDAAGNTAYRTFLVTVVDASAPIVSCSGADGLWHATDVSISCTAADSQSGFAAGATTTLFTLSTAVPLGTETASAATGSLRVCNTVGVCTQAGPISGHKVDKRGPDVSLSNPGFVDGAVFGSRQAPAAPVCLASDGGSGLASCTVAGYGMAVGVHTLTVTATDRVGNVTTQTITYTVAAQTGTGSGPSDRGIRGSAPTPAPAPEDRAIRRLPAVQYALRSPGEGRARPTPGPCPGSLPAPGSASLAIGGQFAAVPLSSPPPWEWEVVRSWSSWSTIVALRDLSLTVPLDAERLRRHPRPNGQSLVVSHR
jgi:hypothetical protein